MDSGIGAELKLPKMRMVRQRFDIPPAVDVLEEVDREWLNIKETSGSAPRVQRGHRGGQSGNFQL